MGELAVRYLTKAEKAASRDLWEEAFPEDSKEFGDYYFREKLKENRILALIEREDGADDALEPGQIQAMVHLNPYRVMVRGWRWQADYLVGVATRQNRRHRGYMSLLLQYMMTDMREERMPFCFLMPANEAIYRPFGFTYIFRQPHWKLAGRELERHSLMFRRDSLGFRRYLGELASWVNRWLEARYEVYALRDEAYMRRLLKEIASEDGTLEVLFDEGRLVGLISEWGRSEREQRLLYGEPPYIEEGAPARPAIMARIITPEIFVRAVRLREPGDERVIVLRLEDPLIPDNDGLWRWHLLTESSWMERADETDGGAEDGPDPVLALRIEELTAWLFGYEVPEAAKPFAGWVETLRGVFLDEVV